MHVTVSVFLCPHLCLSLYHLPGGPWKRPSPLWNELSKPLGPDTRKHQLDLMNCPSFVSVCQAIFWLWCSLRPIHTDWNSVVFFLFPRIPQCSAMIIYKWNCHSPCCAFLATAVNKLIVRRLVFWPVSQCDCSFCWWNQVSLSQMLHHGTSAKLMNVPLKAYR